MDDDLRERREETWERLIVENKEYSKVVSSLADEYDVAESTIRSDISRMENWLPKLDAASDKSAASRLRELRYSRQRRQQMLQEVQSDPDADRKTELRLLNSIDKNIEMDIQLSLAVGNIEQDPEEHVVHHREHGEQGQEQDHNLTDQQEEQLAALRAWARDETVERHGEAVAVGDFDDNPDADQQDKQNTGASDD